MLDEDMSLLEPISNLFKKKSGAGAGKRVRITSINIKLGIDIHSLGEKEVTGDSFDLYIPYSNKLGGGILPDNLKGPDITISSISVEKPFSLISVTPEPPRLVKYMEKEDFRLKIKAPDSNYEGPMFIKFETDSKDNVTLSISKILLVNGGKSIELEESKADMTLKKNQVIRKDIQLYKVLKYQQEVSSVTVNKPFEIIGIEPKLPFVLDKKDSFIAAVFIRAPEFNYAGPMEITFG